MDIKYTSAVDKEENIQKYGVHNSVSYVKLHV